jgi:hypothetical protein
LLAGEVSPGLVTQDSGWDLGTLPVGGNNRYTFFHIGGRFTATLNWNRTIAQYGADNTVTPDPLNDLDLRLFASDSGGLLGLLLDTSASTVDNVEHIYDADLPAGWYTLEASGPAAAGYALSFQSVPEISFPAWIALAVGGWVVWRRHRSSEGR